jgi:hypothetical protein
VDDWRNWDDSGEGITLMQFTGLKDRNGREIYEGDVLDWNGDGGVWVVQWSEKDCGFNMYDAKNPHVNPYPIPLHAKYVSVIGNVYENPELLQRAA